MKLNIGLVLLTGVFIMSGCSKETATSVNNLDGVDIYKYNSEVAKVISLSSGFKESELINSTDMDKLRSIYEENDKSVNQTSIDITDDLSKFLSDVGTLILAKYNYKNYRYEVDGSEFVSDAVVVDRLTDSDREIALKLYKDIESLWVEYEDSPSITADLLDKIYETCDRYRNLSIAQKGLISNITKLGNMVENYEGSVDTNFNVEFWKWNIKKLAGEKVADYDGPSDSDLGIVQGRLMYGENPDGTPYVPIVADNTPSQSSFDNTYDKANAKYDDYESDLIIPEDYYECVVDNGSEVTNYVSDEKLLEKVASIDSSRLYVENDKIYLRINENKTPIKLLNWGILEYYAPDNTYREYDVKDYVYWDDGKFKLGLISLDKVDYRILTGTVKDKKIYFNNIEDAIPKFASVHIDVTKELGNTTDKDVLDIIKEREVGDNTTKSDSNIEESEEETRVGTFNE